MSEAFQIVIIGSGPAGLSAAAHAAKLKISHILLEAEQHASHTIYKYQKGKHVMAEPANLPLRSEMSFKAGKREEVLGAWDSEIKSTGASIRYGQEVASIKPQADGSFVIDTTGKVQYLAQRVILAFGVQGNIRKLGVEGDDLDEVQYTLDDPEAFTDETIVVVGAGDAAIENAVALAKQNRVILLNRNEEFTRCKQGNLDAILLASREGRIEIRYNATSVKVERQADPPLKYSIRTSEGDDEIECNRIIGRLGATPPRKLVESFGVTFPNADVNAVPVLSDTYESVVKGLYIIGALGGYPLIKQAMNQGYEAVEYALGRKVEPADESILKDRFKRFSRSKSVSDVLDVIQKQVPLLGGLNRLQLREFMSESELHVPSVGEVIFERNDYTNSFFMVVSGEVVIDVVDKAGKKTLVRLGPNQFFGELGLISGRRRSSTVRAGDGCVLVETPRRVMLKTMAQVESVRAQIDEVFLKRAIKAYLAPMLPEDQLNDLIADGTELKRFASGEVLFKQGDAADGLYLLRRGAVMVVKELGARDVVLSYLAAGNYLGEMALLSDSPRSATVKASVATEALVLKAEAFKRVLRKNPVWREEIEAQFLDRLRVNALMESEPDPGNVISFLLQQGIGEATDILLIDESLCVRCDNCEKACADVHDGTSRLDREAGPTFAQIHVPTSCRHCEHPHCMKECPPDAIHRSANGEVFITDSCIGCGNCERNCPYGVIQMAAVNPKRSRPSLWSWLVLGLGPEPGLEPKPQGKDIPKKAVKCDMCKDLPGGAACVRACPTGAAIRVSPEKFLKVANLT